MKKKEHRFTLVVKAPGTRRSAELDVLAAFAKREPDGCEFHLRRGAPPVSPLIAVVTKAMRTAALYRKQGHPIIAKAFEDYALSAAKNARKTK